MTGVYFLYLNKELQYIGQSLDIHKRCKKHKIKFDFVGIIICRREDLKSLERNMIAEYNPKYNLQENIRYVSNICPCCDGTGFSKPRSQQIDQVELNSEIAIRLREKGFSIRQIMKALNYKSTHSITELLKKSNGK